MAFNQVFLSALLIAVFCLFFWGRLRHDVIAFAALLAAVVAGVVPFAETFSGFAHPATVTVALVLIISRGFQNSGAVDLMARHLLPPIRSASSHVASLAGVAGALSAVMNNVGALALLMPAALQSAAKIKRSPAVILMPLSFGSILGGLVTLIGTPPNIIVTAVREKATGTPFSMFDFTPVGAAVAVVGIVFIAVGGWRLIPKSRRKKMSQRELFQIETYVSEAMVPDDSKAVGITLGNLDEMAEENDTVILGLIRNDRRIDRAGRRETVRADDILIIEADPDTLDSALRSLGLQPAARKVDEDGKESAAKLMLAEAVVQPEARIAGQTAASLRLRRRYDVNLLAVSRQGHAFRGRLRSFRFRPGDVLLLEGEIDNLPEAVARLGCLPLAERQLRISQPRRAGIAITLFSIMILCASFDLLSLPVALAIAATSMVVLDIVPPRDIYESIDWPVVVLLAAMIPIGTALDTSGATLLAAETLVNLSSGYSPVIVLALILVVTMTLSDVINNAATALVMAPISINVANQLGVSSDPFLMAVAIGASCAFLTPIGHQNNTLILGPGGYHFGDYWRMGLPLEFVVVGVGIPMLTWVWPL